MKTQQSNPQYSERITAFVDILGFESYLYSNSTSASDVLSLLSTQQSVAVSNQVISSSKSDFKIQSFSDNIVISVVNSSDAFSELVCYLVDLFVSSLKSGLFIRGGVQVGDLYQDTSQNVVFGPALVEAYKLESHQANFPRIILSKKLVEQINLWKNDPKATAFYQASDSFYDFIHLYIRQSKDGPYIINVLNDLASGVDEAEKMLLKNIVLDNLHKSIERPEVYIKIRKFAEHWNEVFDREGSRGGLVNRNHKIDLPFY